MERSSEDLYKMEGFIGRRGWEKEASGKEWVVSGEAALHWGKAEELAASCVTPWPARCVRPQAASFPDPSFIAQAPEVVSTKDQVAPPSSQPSFLFALLTTS